MHSLHHEEEKEMAKLFHINIQVKKRMVDSLLNFVSQYNLIVVDLISKIGLKVHDHPNPYPLGCVNNNVETMVTKQCNIKFYISAEYIDEV